MPYPEYQHNSHLFVVVALNGKICIFSIFARCLQKIVDTDRLKNNFLKYALLCIYSEDKNVYDHKKSSNNK